MDPPPFLNAHPTLKALHNLASAFLCRPVSHRLPSDSYIEALWEPLPSEAEPLWAPPLPCPGYDMVSSRPGVGGKDGLWSQTDLGFNPVIALLSV